MFSSSRLIVPSLITKTPANQRFLTSSSICLAKKKISGTILPDADKYPPESLCLKLKSFVSPSLSKVLKEDEEGVVISRESVVGISKVQNSVCWAHVNTVDKNLISWGFHELELPPKQTMASEKQSLDLFYHLTEVLKKQIPAAHYYVIQKSFHSDIERRIKRSDGVGPGVVNSFINYELLDLSLTFGLNQRHRDSFDDNSDQTSIILEEVIEDEEIKNNDEGKSEESTSEELENRVFTMTPNIIDRMFKLSVKSQRTILHDRIFEVQKRFPGLNYYIGNDNFLKLTDNAVIHRECIIESFLNAIALAHLMRLERTEQRNKLKKENKKAKASESATIE